MDAMPVRSVLLLLVSSILGSAAQTVTLGHGGKLEGRRIVVDGTVVDQYFGIRFAKPPTGALRFQKPQPVDTWTGVVNATSPGNMCVQTINTTVHGDEDCLFLDITVPGGIGNSVNKTSMIWIHGGASVFGGAYLYNGVPLALQGDVIVVAINYRLGVFGFLSDESDGTGNYGLWDQRMAIMWVKENIASFGGNPESITIFGESAGASSVVAQMMHAGNEGLFQRVIAQSGTVYQTWNWYLSREARCQMAADLKQKKNCSASQSVFQCHRLTPAHNLLAYAATYYSSFALHAIPDNDFFAANVSNEVYELTRRFDLMAGYTENEGLTGGFMELGYFLTPGSESLDDGMSLAAVRRYLTYYCTTYYTESATEECVQFFLDLYGLEPLDDKERLLKTLEFSKHSNFDTDITHLLKQHSSSDKSTYSYQLSKFVQVPRDKRAVLIPEWVEIQAEHGDDLIYVFGYDRLTDNMSEPTKELWTEAADDYTVKYASLGRKDFMTRDDADFSKRIQTLWSNFAKSGNPNVPVSVGVGTSWPQYEPENEKMLNLNDTLEAIPAPALAIHERLISSFNPVRRERISSEKATCNERETPITKAPTVPNSAPTRIKLGLNIVIFCYTLYFY